MAEDLGKSEPSLGQTLQLSRRQSYLRVLKVIVGCVIGIGLLIALVILSNSTPYVYVDQAVNQYESLKNKKIKVHGFVTAKTIQHTLHEKTLDYQFQIENCGMMIPVKFTGVIPDGFHDDAQVVIEGQFLNTANTREFKADLITTKCASKYEVVESPATSNRCLPEGGPTK